MELSTDLAPERLPDFEAVLTDDEAAADAHAEINARRAQVEDPEMLRRLRSL
jgi:hypothetical protein